MCSKHFQRRTDFVIHFSAACNCGSAHSCLFKFSSTLYKTVYQVQGTSIPFVQIFFYESRISKIQNTKFSFGYSLSW